jgi:hypothetical protein
LRLNHGILRRYKQVLSARIISIHHVQAFLYGENLQTPITIFAPVSNNKYPRRDGRLQNVHDSGRLDVSVLDKYKEPCLRKQMNRFLKIPASTTKCHSKGQLDTKLLQTLPFSLKKILFWRTSATSL